MRTLLGNWGVGGFAMVLTALVSSPNVVAAPTTVPEEIARCESENTTANSRQACKEEQVWARFELAAIATGVKSGRLEGRKLWLLVVGPGDTAVKATELEKVKSKVRAAAERSVLPKLTSDFDSVKGADALVEDQLLATPKASLSDLVEQASKDASDRVFNVLNNGRFGLQTTLDNTLRGTGLRSDRFTLAIAGTYCAAAQNCKMPAYAGKSSDKAYERFAKYYQILGSQELVGKSYRIRAVQETGGIDPVALTDVRDLPVSDLMVPAVQLENFEALVTESRAKKVGQGRIQLSSVAPRLLKLSLRSSIAVVDTLKSPGSLFVSYKKKPLGADAVELLRVSDAVAKTRILDCAALRGRVTEAEISNCAGYKVDTALIATCRGDADRCWPAPAKSDAFQLDAAAIVASNDVDALVAFTALPRLRLADNDAELAALYEKCRASIGGPSPEIDGTTCLLKNTKSASNPAVSAIHECSAAVLRKAKAVDKKQREGVFSKGLNDCLAGAIGGFKNTPEGKLASCALSHGDVVAATLCGAADAEARPWVDAIQNCAPRADIATCLGSKNPAVNQAIAVTNCLNRAGNANGKSQVTAASADAFLGCIPAGDKNADAVKIMAQCVRGVAGKTWDELSPDACLAGNKTALDAMKLLKCTRNAKSTIDAAFCAPGLPAEMDQLRKCINEVGADKQKVALCFVSKNLPQNLKELQKVAACYAQSNGDLVGTTLCAASDKMNQDQRIAMQCLTTTGGEPTAWTTCVAGQLAAKEIRNCKGKKFGDDKCFNENNEIRKLAKNLGMPIGKNSVPADVVNFYLKVYEVPLGGAAAAQEVAMRAVGDFTSTLIDELKKPTGVFVPYAVGRSSCTALARTLFGRKKRC